MTDRRACPRCKQDVARTPSGHLRAHECPHGSQCVVPYARRRLGEKPAHCALCLGTRDAALEPGQLPMPFASGLRARLRRPKKGGERWALPGGFTGRPCPVCGCNRDRRCTVPLEDGGTGACCPAGTFGRKTCSACREPTLPGVTA